MATNGLSEEDRRQSLENLIPSLIRADYELTSVPSEDYNCIAWAAGDTNRCWDDEDEDLYWPTKATIRDGTLASLIEGFSTLGFELCSSGELEPAYGKIAIYGVGVTWCHVAKQLASGRWSSKCGKLDDISHSEVAHVYCDAYCPPLYEAPETPAGCWRVVGAMPS